MGDDGYDFRDPFDAKAWAMYHERICATRWVSTDLKLGLIIKAGAWVGGTAFAVMFGLMTWSLKTNYDNLDAQHRTAAALPATIHQTAKEASAETVLKLGATNTAAEPTPNVTQ